MARLLLKGVGGTNLVFLVLIALLAAACGANSTSTSADTAATPDAVDSTVPEAVAFEERNALPTVEPDLTTIRVAARNSISVSPLWIADSRGFFRDHGIAIEYVTVTSEGAVATAIGVQEANIGLVSASTALAANNQRIRPLVYLDATDVKSDAVRGSASLVVSGQSEISSGCDLEGTNIAVDATNSISAIAVREMVLRDDCNPLTVNFVSLDGNTIAEDLRTGKVDAAATFDPVTAELLRGPNVLAANLDAELCPEFGRCPLWIAAARIEWAQDNPELSRAFVNAMNDAINWIWANEIDYRAELVTCCAVNADDASAIVVPNFTGRTRDLESDLTRLRSILRIQNEKLQALRSEQADDPTIADESESIEDVDG